MFIDLTPLRASPAFARLWIGTSIAQVGSQLAVFTIGIHVFLITGLTAAVALVAAYALVPTVIAGIWGGGVIDAYDRRRVSLTSAVVAISAALGLALLAAAEVRAVTPYYLLAALSAVAGTVSNAARGAIIPRLLPRELLTSAAALRGVANSLSTVGAPALAGLLISTAGLPVAYATSVLLLLVGLVGLWSLPPIPPEGEVTAPGLRSIREGLAFVTGSPNIRVAFGFDLLAMILCEPRVLLPAAGTLIVGGGPLTAGLLGGGFAAGSLAGALLSGGTRSVRRQGLATMVATAAYGLAIAMFGLVLWAASLRPGTGGPEPDWTVLALAGGALALAGAADSVTVIFRSAILQAAVPDHLRGRVQGLFTVVVTSGPRLGDLVAGGLTLLVATWVPSVLGGALLVALVLASTARLRGFLRYDASRPAA